MKLNSPSSKVSYRQITFLDENTTYRTPVSTKFVCFFKNIQKLPSFCFFLLSFVFLILVPFLVNKELLKIKEEERKSIFLSI